MAPRAHVLQTLQAVHQGRDLPADVVGKCHPYRPGSFLAPTGLCLEDRLQR